MSNFSTNLSTLNTGYVQNTAVVNQKTQTAQSNTHADKTRDKKLLYTLAGLAVAGTAIALGVLHHKKVNTKVAQNALQSVGSPKAPQLANNPAISPKGSNVGNAPATVQPALSVNQPVKPSVPKSSPAPAANNSVAASASKTPSAPAVCSNSAAPLGRDELQMQNRMKIIENYSSDHVDFYKDRPLSLYASITNDFYKEIRNCKTPYPKSTASVDNIGDITGRSNSLVKVHISNGWHYRQPINKINAETVGRVSLNVYPEPELIKKLDNIVATSGGIIEYKTPCVACDWHTRHDPITVYFKKTPNKLLKQELIDKVADAAKPHVRKADDSVMLGKKLADGIFKLAEPNDKHAKQLIDRARAMDFDDKFIEFLQSTNYTLGANLYGEHGNGQKYVHSSPGVIEALNRTLDKIEKILA